jgi:hypothetical protein
MAHSISAPVGDKKRITKPDPKKKNEKFDSVSNKPDDVKLVQLMLIANGISSPIDGKCNGGLISAIQLFQKSKLGFKKPDGIVDPGGQTWKAGLPKLNAQIAADARFEGIEIREGGKTKIITVAEFERREKEAKHRMLSKANMMYGQAETWLEFCADAEATLQGADTFTMSLVEFSVRWANKNAEPPYDPLTTARSEASFLKSAVDRSKPVWQKILKQDAKATKAYNARQKAFAKFIDARIGTASKFIGRLEVVREVSFTVVEVYMTARLVATKGMHPAAAHALASGGTEAMKSSANEFGEYLAGNKVTFKDSAEKVLIDTTFGALLGLISFVPNSKFAANLGVKVGAAILPKLTSQAARRAVNVFVVNLLDSKLFQGFVTNMAKESLNAFRSKAKGGNWPTGKDFSEGLIKSVVGSVMSVPTVNGFMKFDANAASKVQDAIINKIGPSLQKAVQSDLIKKAGYSPELVNKVMKDFTGDAFTKVLDGTKDKAVEIYVMGAVDNAKNVTAENQMHKLGEDALRKDAALRKSIQVLMVAEAERQLKQLEKQK